MPIRTKVAVTGLIIRQVHGRDGTMSAMASAVRIGVQGDRGWLGFDLREVMAAVGPQDALRWFMSHAQFNCNVGSVWPEGNLATEAKSREGLGLPLDWTTMSALAEACRQIIDARFVGYDDQSEPHLMLEAVDSSYWVVWATNTAVIDSVRRVFTAVEDYVETAPHGDPWV